MAETIPPYTDMRQLKWSQTEKAIARKAFELALDKRLDAVIQETKDRAARIKQSSQLWVLESYLTRNREDIDRQFDYRYSVLPLVFGNLIRKDLLTEDDLRGLGEDKLALIRAYASL
jgi:Photoprotection regulator fluorescence recovery protein